MRKSLIYSLVFFTLFAFGCQKEDVEVDNQESIEDYLSSHNLAAQKHDSGLYYLIEETGTGAYPTITDKVTLNYKGYLTDKRVFDNNNNTCFELSKVITGWQLGLPLLREGGKGKLFVPAHLGYGNRQYGMVPPNSVLIFDVELLKVE